MAKVTFQRVLQKPKQTKHSCFTNCCGLYDSTGGCYYLKNSNGFTVIFRVKSLLLLSMGYKFPHDLAAGSFSKLPPKRVTLARSAPGALPQLFLTPFSRPAPCCPSCLDCSPLCHYLCRFLLNVPPQVSLATMAHTPPSSVFCLFPGFMSLHRTCHCLTSPHLVVCLSSY